jgi:hypothetical protein
VDGVDAPVPAAQAVDDVRDAIVLQPFVKVIMPGYHRIRTPASIWPLNLYVLTLPGRNKGWVMEKYQPPSCFGRVQHFLQPAGLYRIGDPAVRLIGIASQDKNMNRSLFKIIITFIARQGEVIQIWLDVPWVPVVVTQGREEAVFCSPWSIIALIGVDVCLIILTDILIDGLLFASGIIVVAGGDDKVDVPAIDYCSDSAFGRTSIAKIAL